MAKEIKIEGDYKIVSLFESIKKGEIYLIPFDKKRYNGIRAESCRRNRDARLTGELKSKMDVKFRVSATEYPGYTSLIRVK